MSAAPFPPEFERALALGLSRATSKVAEESALATLALLAQRKRHRRAKAMPSTASAAERLHNDPRSILPEAARRPLLRLGTSLPKDGWSFVGPAVFDRLDARGLRLHPFDLPRLEPLLTVCRDRLGPAENAWLALRRTAQEVQPADAPADSESEWALLPKAQKAAAVRQLRRTDAGAARERVERHLSAAPADVRAALVEALETGLGAADTPLLERLAKDDRATSVRDAANALLSATRGSAAYDAKLAAAVGLMETGRTLLGRRTLKLSASELPKLVDVPANASTGARNLAAAEALQRAFQHLAFSDLARALSMTPEDLAGAIGDEALATPLAIAALAEGGEKVAAKLLPFLTKLPLAELIARFGQQLLRLDAPTRATVLEALTPNVQQWRWANELQWLGRMAHGQVSDALARRLLAGGVWQASAAPSLDATTFAVFASILPSGRQSDFVTAITDLPRKETAAAHEFIAFTNALEGSVP